MKRMLTIMLAFVLLCSFFGCDNKKTDANAELYNKACGLFIELKYAEAKETFESLGDYEDSPEMAKKCEEKIIEEQLQGRWDIYIGSQTNCLMYYLFDNDSLSIKVPGTDEIYNTGTYWLDTENKLIYYCIDTTEKEDRIYKESDGLNDGAYVQTLVGYQVRCAYDFQDGKLTLIDKDQDAEAESVTRYIKRESEE